VFFYPKFYCELNFIEQCWGHAKMHYRKMHYQMLPLTNKEAEMEKNVIACLDKVDIEKNSEVIIIFLFANWSAQFMDAYRCGLTGAQAVWANKKYRGHRVLPDTIMEELDIANCI
ncbi:hypothetical protein M422DRAFT_155317, partial [Sphaerobolus stellatus SS14]